MMGWSESILDYGSGAHTVDIFREFRDAEIDETHVLLATETNCLHEGLQDVAVFLGFSGQRANENAGKDLLTFEAAGEA